MSADITTPQPQRKEFKPFHEQVAEKLIEQMNEGTAPWQKPWAPGANQNPMNPNTGKNYRGVNNLWLRMQGFTDPRFLTFNQANDNDWKVKKGEKGMPVQYWVYEEKRDKLDENGQKILGFDGKPERETIQLDKPKVIYSTVFNAQQIDGIPELPKQDVKELQWEPVERAEKIVEALKFSSVSNGIYNKAFYRPDTDEICMPARESFKTAEGYYDTLLHEAAHGTGHESRLNREFSRTFGSSQYAREELRAEIASMMINSEIGLAHDSSNSVAYVADWVQELKNHPMEILRAAQDADRIRHYMFEQERTLTQANETTQERSSAQEIPQDLPQEPRLELPENANGKFQISDDQNGYIVNAQLHDETWVEFDIFDTRDEACEFAEKAEKQVSSDLEKKAQEHLGRDAK